MDIEGANYPVTFASQLRFLGHIERLNKYKMCYFSDCYDIFCVIFQTAMIFFDDVRIVDRGCDEYTNTTNFRNTRAHMI